MSKEGTNVHQYKGKLIVHTGSMFSGKTSSLKNELKRFNIAGYKTVAFKPSIDTRYKKNEIVTHDMTSIECILVDDIDQLMDYCNKLNPHVIGIDEIQFLGGSVQKILAAINELLAKDITVVVAGLDMDYTGTPFEVVKELMPYKHHAVCVRCGSDAWVSHRKTKDKDRIKIGAEDDYEPLCRKCFFEVKKSII
jgi:thymidine kinase